MNYLMVRASSAVFVAVFLFLPPSITAQANKSHSPTWWDKYLYVANNGATDWGAPTSSILVGGNVDVSNECGPQSETFITLNQNRPKYLAAGSNEIFRLPMRGYFSSNSGSACRILFF